jgi:dolichol kinase
VILFTPKINGSAIEYLIGFIAVAIGAISENISGSWADDNVTIPVSIGVVMWVLYLWWLPHLNIILPNVPV